MRPIPTSLRPRGVALCALLALVASDARADEAYSIAVAPLHHQGLLLSADQVAALEAAFASAARLPGVSVVRSVKPVDEAVGRLKKRPPCVSKVCLIAAARATEARWAAGVRIKREAPRSRGTARAKKGTSCLVLTGLVSNHSPDHKRAYELWGKGSACALASLREVVVAHGKQVARVSRLEPARKLTKKDLKVLKILGTRGANDGDSVADLLSSGNSGALARALKGSGGVKVSGKKPPPPDKAAVRKCLSRCDDDDKKCSPRCGKRESGQKMTPKHRGCLKRCGCARVGCRKRCKEGAPYRYECR